MLTKKDKTVVILKPTNKYQLNMHRFNKCNKITWKCISYHQQTSFINVLTGTILKGE